MRVRLARPLNRSSLLSRNRIFLLSSRYVQLQDMMMSFSSYFVLQEYPLSAFADSPELRLQTMMGDSQLRCAVCYVYKCAKAAVADFPPFPSGPLWELRSVLRVKRGRTATIRGFRVQAVYSTLLKIG